MPWTGIMYNFNGMVKNCIRSSGSIGNIKDSTIEEILSSDRNLNTQENMLNDRPGSQCHTCYDLERGKKRLDVISDRIFYMRELKDVSFDTYQYNNHDLRSVDLRWSNVCNSKCVYCGSSFSSLWAQELGEKFDVPTEEQKSKFKEYIFQRAHHLRHVDLAGGEPLLMKENLEFLEILKKVNPSVNIRINTNLSKTDTKVFEAVCGFQNVHWTVSVESIGKEFEYIRYGTQWEDFSKNLDTIKLLDHKITFNMLYFLLNYRGLFECVDLLQNLGFHNNSFVIGALLTPLYLNIRHLPENVLQSIEEELKKKINQKPGYLLEDSLKNLLHYIQQPFEKNLKDSFDQLKKLDQRRNLDSSKIFTDLYALA